MDHHEIVASIKRYSENNDSIQGLFALGSYARNELGPYSDIDLVLLTKKKPSLIFCDVKNALRKEIRYIIQEKLDKQIFLLGQQLIKLDLIIVEDPEQVKKYYLGSNITNSDQSVLVDKTDTLVRILQSYKDDEDTQNIVAIINNEINKFLISFESASSAARKEDVFLSYFQYNLSLTRYIRLIQLHLGDLSYLYSPKRILNRVSLTQVQRIERISGTLRLYEIRDRLKRLTIEFKEIHSKLHSRHKNVKTTPSYINIYLEDILTRDLIWNIRDVSWVDPNSIKKKKLLRASAISRFDSSKAFKQAIKDYDLQRVIDLRQPWEIDRYPYGPMDIEVINVPMNTTTDQEHQIFHGDCPEHVLILNNSEKIKTIFNLLSEGKTTLIHCHAGRDRTGVIIALVMLALCIPTRLIETDFLASRMNLQKQQFDHLISAVESKGGIKELLKKYRVNMETVEKIRGWIIND